MTEQQTTSTFSWPPGWKSASAAALFFTMLAHPNTAAGNTLRPFQCLFEHNSLELAPKCIDELRQLYDKWEHLRRLVAPSDAFSGSAHIAPSQERLVLRIYSYATDTTNEITNRRLNVRRSLAVIRELQRLGIPEQFLIPVGLQSDGTSYTWRMNC